MHAWIPSGTWMVGNAPWTLVSRAGTVSRVCFDVCKGSGLGMTPLWFLQGLLAGDWVGPWASRIGLGSDHS